MKYQEMTKKNFLTQKDFFVVTLKSTPQDKIDWKPDNSSMSAKEMIEHLAGSNHYFASMITGNPPPEMPLDLLIQMVSDELSLKVLYGQDIGVCSR